MDVKQEGAGYCGRCHSPLMTVIGRGPVCLACEEAAKPKTGRTVVVTGEQGTGIEGVVMGHEVPHQVGADSPIVPPNVKPLTPPLRSNGENMIHLSLTLDDLDKPNILLTIMQALYDGIDNLPPPPTIKETKKAIKLQEIIQSQIDKLKGE